MLSMVADYMNHKPIQFAEVKTLTNCSKILLCGKKSRNEKEKAVVKIEELQMDDRFDGAQFEREYAKAASIIYKTESIKKSLKSAKIVRFIIKTKNKHCAMIVL